jgi:hypothetical protein
MSGETFAGRCHCCWPLLRRQGLASAELLQPLQLLGVVQRHTSATEFGDDFRLRCHLIQVAHARILE